MGHPREGGTVTLPYELFIGLRYLKTARKGVALTVLISTLGVTVGVAALIATLAVMTGFKEELRDKILGANAHIVINHHLDDEFENVESVIEKIKPLPGVVAAAPFILRQVLLSSDAGALGVVLRGIDPAREATVTKATQNIVVGKWEDLNRSASSNPDPSGGAPLPGILLGVELASRLEVFVGDTLYVVSPVGLEKKSLPEQMGLTPKIRKFQLVGIFSTGMYEYDSALAYVSLKSAQDFFNVDHRVSGIAVRVATVDQAADIAQTIDTQLGFPYYALDWFKMNRNLFSALQLEKIVMFIILILIILVASFNIVSTLIMTVLQKGREIAILKAIGATQKGIMRIFMLEGIVIGAMGVLFGLPLGILICSLLSRFYTLPMDVYYINHIPVQLLPVDLLFVSVSAVLIGFLATLYPSWQAARLDPAEALRYE